MTEEEAIKESIKETDRVMQHSKHYPNQSFTKSTALMAIMEFIRLTERGSTNEDKD